MEKYRIKQVGNAYFPQIKRFLRWKFFIDYTQNITKYEYTAMSFISGTPLPVHYNPVIEFPSVDKAREFIANEIKENEVKIHSCN